MEKPSNVGILTIPIGCYAQTRDYFFHRSHTYYDTTNVSHRIPLVNHTNQDIKISTFKPIALPTIRSFNPTLLQSLAQEQAEDQRFSDTGFGTISQPIINWTNVGISIVISICLFVFFWFKCKTRRLTGPTQPLMLPYTPRHAITLSALDAEHEIIPLHNLRRSQRLRQLNPHHE